ncbi:hypothetical protein B0T22DRAFT_368794 [Podospora appendiculata]|uniref:C2H2-type domain-containing protein n=1 Tax=Podospora appendiculata TaxID=314037 RepID=A0AAE0XI44_9PEZI|nr:hypothetical protein B0T22DRAFT_368794 [Podospora appendiculata]
MPSAYMQYPSSPAVDSASARRDRMSDPRYNVQTQDSHNHFHPSTPVAAGHLSAQSPQYQYRSSSASPLNNTNTPAESISTLSVNYQSSEFSEIDDQFFGISFDNVDDGSPAFLDNSFLQLAGNDQLIDQSIDQPVDQPALQSNLQGVYQTSQAAPYLPLSPDKTPSLSIASPNGERRGSRPTFPTLFRSSVALPELATLSKQSSASLQDQQSSYQYTPDTSGSGQSSDDGLAPAAIVMPSQSPRVTVSDWEKDSTVVSTGINVYSAQNQDHDISPSSAVRDDGGRWVPNQATGQSGLDPGSRTSAEVPSLNESTAQRALDEQKKKVNEWLHHQPNETDSADAPQALAVNVDEDDGIPQREIALGHETENNYVPGQTYYTGKGGELTQQDVDIMRENRNWADAPLPFAISRADSRHYQPETANAAIMKFEKLCRDNDSVVSRAATWGTRRRSLPSISDFEGITSGNFLKKLSLSRGDVRRPSILKELRGMVSRTPSTKRFRVENDDNSGSAESLGDRKETQTNLAPPARSPSWKKQQAVPSINTAFYAMGSKVASIGTTHARSGSVSATPITSPRSASGFSLNVMKPLNRIRSKSDLTKNQPTSNLADIWRQSGGPPVPTLTKTASSAAELDDDDDEEDDLYEDGDMKPEANKILDEIAPNLAGFQQHVLKLNPLLNTSNTYLVDRIAYQQIVRYKSLLNSRVKHIQQTANQNCSSGSMCIAQGGSANVIDSKGDARGLDPMSARYDGSDGDITPLEGVLTSDSFPPDIPMPPTTSLPAEFECQLCFLPKKFQKPSDWTKHVHEDVQPFTCTWDRCRDPKIFKRKADWVRHENEGHRHLEWWTCDVDDCRHICYRRDNFLQHLVREHKFAEPKVKTKAAIKRAGAPDPTWAKVEQCHQDTHVLPQQEPCRFCNKVFPSWKKLTVHLAKHMEQISLPILKLVERKELEIDTIISPVQEPPPRQFPATFPAPFSIKREQMPYDMPSSISHPPQINHYQQAPQQQQPWYPVVPQGYQPQLYNTPFDSMHHHGLPNQSPLNVQQGHPHGFGSLNSHTQPGYNSALAVTTSPFMQGPSHQFGSELGSGGGIHPSSAVEPFPATTNNALGLQDPNMYNVMMDPHSAGGPIMDGYTPQGSVSPFSHSPNHGQLQGQQGGYYG